MKIAEVSEKYNISKDTLRWYEKIGIITDVERKPNGVREYSEENCQMIESIICMRSAGLSIDVLKNFFNLLKEGDSTLEQRRDLLLEQKRILQESYDQLSRTMEKLDRKIQKCEQLIIDKKQNK